MTEAAPRTAPQSNYVPLKDYQYTHCRHCNSTQHCDPNSLSMLNCILAAMLQAHAYKYKVYNERGW